MAIINNLQDLIVNLRYFQRRDERRVSFVRRGRCFIAYDLAGEVVFAPSRFVGYVSNTFEKHEKRGRSLEGKDGKVTNPAISKVFGYKPKESEELDSLYRSYCIQLGVPLRNIDKSTKTQKFWDMRRS